MISKFLTLDIWVGIDGHIVIRVIAGVLLATPRTQFDQAQRLNSHDTYSA